MSFIHRLPVDVIGGTHGNRLKRCVHSLEYALRKHDPLLAVEVPWKKLGEVHHYLLLIGEGIETDQKRECFAFAEEAAGLSAAYGALRSLPRLET